jgi:hypothetical protein
VKFLAAYDSSSCFCVFVTFEYFASSPEAQLVSFALVYQQYNIDVYCEGGSVLKYALIFVSGYCFPLGFVPANFMQRVLLFCHCWKHDWHRFSDNCVLNSRGVLETAPSLLRFLSRKQEVTKGQIRRERWFGWGGGTTMFVVFRICPCICSSISIRFLTFNGNAPQVQILL